MRPIGLEARRVHFIGIGGISMSGLSEILKKNGYAVSGSDLNATDITRHLNGVGIPVAQGHAPEHITDDIDLVVYTAAVKPDNPEYRAAAARGVPMMERSTLLGRIMDGYAYPIGIAGTHGKTTTTSLVADTCLTAGLDPTISIGGHMGEGYNYKIGDSPYIVTESDEYADSFLQCRPYIGAILNIENDHMDFHKTMDKLYASFAQFARHIRPDGALVIHAGVPDLARVTEGLKCRVITFGGEGSDYMARDVRYTRRGRPSFDLITPWAVLGRAELGVPGAHNVQNALACAAVTHTLGIKPEDILLGLKSARGVRRRYEYKGVFNGADVVDDYAHHPTEIRAFLAAARADRARQGSRGRVICLFQPHTYSRTRNLLDDTAESFGDADLVYFLPIFPAREQFDPTISSQQVVEKINARGGNARCFANFEDAVAGLSREVIPGDLLITMGAGDVYKVGETLLRTTLSTLSTGV